MQLCKLKYSNDEKFMKSMCRFNLEQKTLENEAFMTHYPNLNIMVFLGETIDRWPIDGNYLAKVVPI